MRITSLILKAETETQQRLLDYLDSEASEALIDKINAGKKTLGGALEYAKSEARKLAGGAGCICIADETVFGWVIHFFEEDDVKEVPKKAAIKGPAGAMKKTALVKKPAPAAVVGKKAKGKPAVVEQASMMEALFNE